MQIQGPALKKFIEKRRKKRDSFWNDASDLVLPPAQGGWTKMPRTIPMIAGLIDLTLSEKEKPGRVYIALWCQEFGDGLVDNPDPSQLALEAGYVTPRAERTVIERLKALRHLGFIRAQTIGNREFGAILLADPHRVICALRMATPEKVPDSWWTAFQVRCADIGVELDRFMIAHPTSLRCDGEREGAAGP